MSFMEDLGKALSLRTYKLRVVQELKTKLRWTKLSKLRFYSVIRLILGKRLR